MSAPRSLPRLRGAAASSRRAAVGILLAAALGTGAGLVSGGPAPASADVSPSTSSPACPSYNTPNELTLVNGTPQTAKLDSAFAAPFQVALANTNGCPVTSTVAGTAITFSAPTSGPSGTFGATGSASVLVGTDATGTASVSMFVANDISGGYTLTASSSYGSVTFSLVNTATGIAASLVPQAPLTEAAYVSAHYNRPLSVEVMDANGAPVEGASVVFSLGAGGAAGGGGGAGASATAGASFDGGQSQATEPTDAAGIATSPLFSADADAGSFTATASVAGVTEPAVFKLDNVAGKPPRVALVGSARRSAALDGRYAAPLQVEVIGADGKPMQGVSVTFALGAAATGGNGGAGAATAGASFLDGSSQATATTGVRGRATSPFFRANDTAGTFTASIAVPGLTNPLTVTLDNLAGRSGSIDLLGTGHRSATVQERYRRPLEVKVMNGNGEPVQGASVTFALGAASASGAGGAGPAGAGASFLNGSAQATETTAADGLAVSPLFTANGTAGTFTATASVAGVTNPVMVTLDNLAAGPPRLALVDPSPASAPVGDRYNRPLEVRVTAADGDPVQGTTVTFTLGGAAAAGGASGSAGAGASFVGGSTQATATTDADGRASSPAFTANTVAGTFTAAASTSGARIATLTLRNRAARPSAISAGAAASEQTTIGQRFPIGLAVTVTDTDRNPVPDAWVTFRAPRGGPSGRFHHAGGIARTVRVRTNSDGIAVAPAFVANRSAGGYVVTASVAGAGTAAFALVNQPLGPSA